MERLHSALLKEEVFRDQLPNGLQVYLLRKAGYHRSYATVATRYGSTDSRFVPAGAAEPLDVPPGIAHFLEHKLFEEEGGSVFDRFAERGASANAFTSYTLTAYLFSCTEAFHENLRLLLNFVGRPYFTDELVEKEKGIIEQELKMYDDHPDRVLVRNLLEALYHRNPVRIDIGGTVESVRQITKEQLSTCYATFYHPSNMVLFAAGDLDPQETLRVVRETASDGSPRGEIRRFYPEEPPAVRERRVEQRMAVSRPRYALGLKDTATGFTGEDLMRREIAHNMLLHMVLGRSSEAYQRLYEEGLIDDGFSAYYTASPLYGHAILGGETDDPDRLHDELTRILERFRRDGFPDADFRRAKRQAMGEFLNGFNSLEFIAHSFVSYHFRQANFFRYLEIVQEMPPEELRAHAEGLLDLERSSVSVVRPR
ncbi:EF-P 5-aminopentanol modification-associated protein YfmH [Limnochorda pilosa]|uniref:Zinc protease n=1 Tax=Limnochorda pilosa TaxID=1555112 RepID=A0A0K2SJ08_LIMPI|nr:pitrilysin family protein [Limnochorda pilosa]BAS27075.1 zinc protease [Limnochorda pilosa]